jgi:hypothetical protein
MYLWLNAAAIGVNPNDIAMLGYSAGGITLGTAMSKPYIFKNMSAAIVVSGAAPGQLDLVRSPDEKPSLILHCDDDGLVPFWMKYKGVSTEIPKALVHKLQEQGIKSSGIFYPGCFHHPWKNIGVYDDIDRFLSDPSNFQASEDPSEQLSTDVIDNWEYISETAGCYINNEGIKPVVALSVFSQIVACQVFCYYSPDCVAIDFYKSFSYERPDGFNNCYLYSEPCTTPLFDVGSDTKKTAQVHEKEISPSRSSFYKHSGELHSTKTQANFVDFITHGPRLVRGS